jgi:hypothetical protein
MFGRSATAISPSCIPHAACQIVSPHACPRAKAAITQAPRASGCQTGGRQPDMRWPDFGLTVTPNADNCCALLSSILAGQRQDSLVRETRVDIYGSEGWGFESLRARKVTGPFRPSARLSAAAWEPTWEPSADETASRVRLIDSAAARFSPSTKCPYTSLVIAMLAWPRTSETTCNGQASVTRPSAAAHADANGPSPPACTSARRYARSCPGRPASRPRS